LPFYGFIGQRRRIKPILFAKRWIGNAVGRRATVPAHLKRIVDVLLALLALPHAAPRYGRIHRPNGRLQQIAANRFSIPQDSIAILLQGFVLASLFAFSAAIHSERSRTLSGLDSTTPDDVAPSQPRPLDERRQAFLI
jgi:hypothetical protein